MQASMDMLLEQYKPLVLKKAKTLFLAGGEKDDLIQEGMIGLYKAIRDFDETAGLPFPAFAEICITRQMYSAIRSDTAKKNAPLNDRVELDEENVKRTATSPEEIVLDQKMAQFIEEEIRKRLSEFELQVMDLYMKDMDYLMIADALDRSPKTIDNALQRIRAKARKVLAEIEK
ncbi:MAG: sigma-70 family RNA polymerase sigma factor [Lachnospiraceae bacterium]|nr:sigma-70 family RNA polymerase sigma factor [Lachnospiraceae bacterium]